MEKETFYLVVVYSFDKPLVEAYSYETEEAAKKALSEIFQKELAIAVDENGWVVTDATISNDGCYAIIDNPDNKIQFYISKNTKEE